MKIVMLVDKKFLKALIESCKFTAFPCKACVFHEQCNNAVTECADVIL